MLDLGLTKLALIGVVALVVIGPEKLPKVARMAGTIFGRAQRYINEVKSEVSREIELEELRNVQKDLQSVGQEVEQSFAETLAEAKNEFQAGVGSDHAETNPLVFPPDYGTYGVKARNFRKKKIARTAAVPTWYKQRHGGRMHVISTAARVAKYRPRKSLQ